MSQEKISIPPTPGKRLRHIRKELKLSQGALAEQLDISQSTLSQIENDYYTLSLSAMWRLNELHRVNSNWLISGNGKIFIGLDKVNADSDFIPLVNAEAHAGYPDNRESVDFIGQLDRFKIPGIEILSANNNYRIFEIEGDSMEPTLYDGDFVACRRREEGLSQLTRGQLAVVITTSGIICKRFYLSDKSEFDYIMDSDNPVYKPEILRKDEVLEVWMVHTRVTNHINAIGTITNDRLDLIEKKLYDVFKLLERMTDQSSPSGMN